MPVSNVQLDTGIGVGKAQVFKPLDVQGIYDAQQRRKATDEAAKARKVKEEQDRKDDALKQLRAYDMLPRHRDALESQGQKVLDLLYKPNPNMKEVEQELFKYASMGKQAQAVKKSAEAVTIKTAKGEWDNVPDFEGAIAPVSDPASPNYNPALDPKNPAYDIGLDFANIQTKGDSIAEFKREPKYLESLQNIAQDLGTQFTKTMDAATMTATERKTTPEQAKKDAWDALVGGKNYYLFNGVKQIMRDAPGTTEEQALAQIKPVWDNSFDTTVKTTLDKQQQEQQFKFSRGSGSVENKNWSLRLYPESSTGGQEIDIQKIAPAGYNEVMTVEVFDKNNRKIGIEATPVKYIKQPNGKFTALVAVPKLDELNKPTGESEYFETTPDGYGAVVTKVGIDPYAMIQGLGGNKTFQTKSGTPEKKTTTKVAKTTTKAAEKKYSASQEALIKQNMDANPNYTRQEIVDALIRTGKIK